MVEVTVEPVTAELVRPLRGEVLRPRAAPSALAFAFDEDPRSGHFAARRGEAIIGVASVLPDAHPRAGAPGDWRIRGMAVSPALRGRGIGTLLLDACLAHARAGEGRRVWCNARIAAVGLYERAGLTIEGAPFELEDIGIHHLMAAPLAQP